MSPGEGEMHLPGVREREDEVWVDSTMIMLIMPNVINMYLRIALKSPIEITRSQAICVPWPSTCQLTELEPDVRQHMLRERLIARTFLIDKAPGRLAAW